MKVCLGFFVCVKTKGFVLHKKKLCRREKEKEKAEERLVTTALVSCLSSIEEEEEGMVTEWLLAQQT